MNKFLKILLSIIILGIVVLAFIGYNIKKFGENSKPQKSDCVIVLGCSLYRDRLSPFLEGRIEEGRRLIEEGYADYIIVSGGQGPSEDMSEAEAMKRYLVEKGMKEDKIIKEDKSASTMENLVNSKKIMDDKGFKSAIVVSNKYHIKRASLMAEKIKLNASYSGINIKGSESDEKRSFLREIPAITKFYILGN